jgi:hypothetical protein
MRKIYVVLIVVLVSLSGFSVLSHQSSADENFKGQYTLPSGNSYYPGPNPNNPGVWRLSLDNVNLFFGTPLWISWTVIEPAGAKIGASLDRIWYSVLYYFNNNSYPFNNDSSSYNGFYLYDEGAYQQGCEGPDVCWWNSNNVSVTFEYTVTVGTNIYKSLADEKKKQADSAMDTLHSMKFGDSGIAFMASLLDDGYSQANTLYQDGNYWWALRYYNFTIAHADEIIQGEHEYERQMMQRNVIVVSVIVLLCVIIGVTIFLVRKKRRKNKLRYYSPPKNTT